MKIKFLIPVLSGLSLFALQCSPKPTVNPYNSNEINPVLSGEKPEIDYLDCSGKGSLNSQGLYKARLSFTFYTSRDSSHMAFSDILGRRVLEINSSMETIQVRDILKNETLMEDEIFESYPAFMWMNSNTLMRILWGQEPLLPDSLPNEINWDGELKFEHENSEFGQRIKSVSYESGNGLDKVNILFRSREYRTASSKLPVDINNSREGE